MNEPDENEVIISTSACQHYSRGPGAPSGISRERATMFVHRSGNIGVSMGVDSISYSATFELSDKAIEELFYYMVYRKMRDAAAKVIAMRKEIDE